MARSFSGSNGNYWTFTSGFDAAVKPFSLSVWVNTASLAANCAVIGQNAGSNGGLEFRIDTTAKLELLDLGQASLGTSTGTITNATWTNIGVTFDSSNNWVFYIAGLSSGSGNGGALTTGKTPYILGEAIGTIATPEKFNGSIADFAMWNVVLTAGEFAALAKGVRPSRVRPLAITAWAPLDGLQSPEPDYGNKKTLTLTGTSAAAAGPPIALLTSRQPQFIVAAAAAAATTVFRRTLSSLGTRVGSRQIWAG